MIGPMKPSEHLRLHRRAIREIAHGFQPGERARPDLDGQRAAHGHALAADAHENIGVIEQQAGFAEALRDEPAVQRHVVQHSVHAALDGGRHRANTG